MTSDYQRIRLQPPHSEHGYGSAWDSACSPENVPLRQEGSPPLRLRLDEASVPDQLAQSNLVGTPAQRHEPRFAPPIVRIDPSSRACFEFVVKPP